MEILEAIILGIIQGITEWLPVSSEGINSLVMVGFFKRSLSEAVLMSLWLHLGTLLSAVIFFRKEIKNIFNKWNDKYDEAYKLTRFLVIGTITSLVIAGPLFFYGIMDTDLTGKTAMGIIGALLIITGVMQRVAVRRTKSYKHIDNKDGVIAGIGQGFSILPGISRSGITSSILLLRKHDVEESLRLSFLMSIPVVIILIISILVFKNFVVSLNAFIAMAIAFVLGLATIKTLFKIAKELRFGYFCVFMGVVTLAALLI